jgi:hypothetical protein
MRIRMSLRRTILAAVAAMMLALAVPTLASAASANDAFYKYTGSTPLANYAPGAVLKSRTVPYHILGLATPLKATQLLYRATDAQGRASVNVTSVVQPSCFLCLNREKVVSYQSAYDSLNPDDQPSVQIAGGLSLGGILPQGETALFAPFLLAGYTVVVPDTEGQTADFAAGPEYGTNTLDSLRAAKSASSVSLSNSAKVVLIGYSGGAIATEWAAELAPTYAPDLNKNLIGATMGGVLVHPAHNLPYVEGTPIWAGVAPMALIGIARSYGIDLAPYASATGAQLLAKLDKASIVNVLAQYGGLKWADLVKPQYINPNSIPEFVTNANKVIMGTGGTPKIPLQITQGNAGEMEGTPGNKPGIGKGDGVMIAGDVRTLARGYCSKGVKVDYSEVGLSHVGAMIPWVASAVKWTFDRFGLLGPYTIPSNCSSIKPGNPLTPLVYQP